MKQNYFPTLNEALNSEDLVESWDISFSPIGYNETKSWTYDNGTKHGHFVSIYRDERGFYERPVHYNR